MSQRLTRISKFLSLVLRHRPDKIALTLDDAGWAGVDELLAALNRHNFPVTREELQTTVATNDKQRFAFNEDATKIRASQGHSVAVALDYQPAVPPAVLYHGTVARFLDSIRAQGLLPGNRHHVHLSADDTTARRVGARRGAPIVLQIDAARMHADGYVFYLSANGVWLAAHVPSAYLAFPPY